MSELLERILREIRERLAASRVAVLEHERLEAALHALGGAAPSETRPVGARRRDPVAAARATTGPSSPRAERSATTPAGAAGAEAPRRSPASSARRRARSRPQARRGAPARPRAARGANRDAVLRVVAERPGVSAREIAAVSNVSGGTLYALLRTLTERGELEKRALPGGRSGYALAPPDADTPATTPTPASSEEAPAASSAPAPLDSTEEHDDHAAPAAAVSPQPDLDAESGQSPANDSESSP